MIVQKSIEIAAPAAKIWPLLIEPDKISKWYTTMQQFKYTSQQHSGVGTPFYFEEKAGGRLMKLNFIITEWGENQGLAFKMTSGQLYQGL